jgi:inositol phosphorylceramide mannosyltransferase catalytic subunit
MIPKRIIQTGPAEVPLLLKSAMATVRLLHPDFEYVFFNDADIESFLAEHFPEHARTYQSFRHRIQRYDFFRYLAIYHFGGFYLDLDVFLARPLTPLLASGCVFPFEELSAISFLWEQFRMDWQIGNYAFGAPPGDPFLAAVIANCIRAQEDEAWVEPMMKGIPKPFRPQFYVLNTTGPGLVSRTLAERSDLACDVNVLFPPDVRNPATWHQLGDFGVHHMIGSWRGRSGFLKQRLLRLWDRWTLRRILANSKKRGRARQVPQGTVACGLL